MNLLCWKPTRLARRQMTLVLADFVLIGKAGDIPSNKTCPKPGMRDVRAEMGARTCGGRQQTSWPLLQPCSNTTYVAVSAPLGRYRHKFDPTRPRPQFGQLRPESRPPGQGSFGQPHSSLGISFRVSRRRILAPLSGNFIVSAITGRSRACGILRGSWACPRPFPPLSSLLWRSLWPPWDFFGPLWGLFWGPLGHLVSLEPLLGMSGKPILRIPSRSWDTPGWLLCMRSRHCRATPSRERLFWRWARGMRRVVLLPSVGSGWRKWGRALGVWRNHTILGFLARIDRSALAGQIAESDCIWPEFGQTNQVPVTSRRARSKSAKLGAIGPMHFIGPTSVHFGQNSASKSSQLRSSSAQLRPNSPKIGATWAELAPISPNCVRDRPYLATCGRSRANFGPQPPQA